MIKDIIMKANILIMNDRVKIFSKSKDKYIFEIFDDSDNCKYTQTIQMGKGCYYISCDCKNSSVHGNSSFCSHKWCVMKILEMDIYKLK